MMTDPARRDLLPLIETEKEGDSVREVGPYRKNTGRDGRKAGQD